MNYFEINNILFLQKKIITLRKIVDIMLMTKNLKKLTAISLFLLGIMVSCSKNGGKDNIKEEYHIEKEYLQDSLMMIGKWQLVNLTVEQCLPLPSDSIVMRTIDYSSYNIVYEFKTNGIMTATNEIDGNTLPRKGIHTYFFKQDDRMKPFIFADYMLIISDRKFWYSISSEVLMVDLMMSAKTTYKFVKIE